MKISLWDHVYTRAQSKFQSRNKRAYEVHQQIVLYGRSHIKSSLIVVVIGRHSTQTQANTNRVTGGETEFWVGYILQSTINYSKYK
jgi:hypothetical protein